MVDRYRLAEFFTDGGVEFVNRVGFTIVRRDQNRWHALLDQQNGIPDWLPAGGAKQITLTRVTLEEMFVALVKEEQIV